MFYGTYKEARDASWHFLIETGACSLPLPVMPICKKMGIKILYDTNKTFLSYNTRGISFQSKGVWHILLNPESTTAIKRYTIAHELGHIYMGHPMQDGKYGRTFGVQQSIASSSIEYQAERFAIGILAPACVLCGLGVHTAGDIARICGISFSAAQRRAERMATLYERGKFFTSPLEREVYKAFEDFIRENREL